MCIISGRPRICGISHTRRIPKKIHFSDSYVDGFYFRVASQLQHYYRCNYVTKNDMTYKSIGLHCAVAEYTVDKRQWTQNLRLKTFFYLVRATYRKISIITIFLIICTTQQEKISHLIIYCSYKHFFLFFVNYHTFNI